MNDQHLDVLNQILKWIRVQAMPSVKKLLEDNLQKSEHRRLYQTLNGSKTQKQLSDSFGISQSRISQLLSAWHRIGIVAQSSPGKYTKSFDLEELGIATDSKGE